MRHKNFHLHSKVIPMFGVTTRSNNLIEPRSPPWPWLWNRARTGSKKSRKHSLLLETPLIIALLLIHHFFLRIRIGKISPLEKPGKRQAIPLLFYSAGLKKAASNRESCMRAPKILDLKMLCKSMRNTRCQVIAKMRSWHETLTLYW